MPTAILLPAPHACAARVSIAVPRPTAAVMPEMLMMLSESPAASSSKDEFSLMWPQKVSDTMNRNCSRKIEMAVGHKSLSILVASSFISLERYNLKYLLEVERNAMASSYRYR